MVITGSYSITVMDLSYVDVACESCPYASLIKHRDMETYRVEEV
jgi:hypothetical protein